MAPGTETSEGPAMTSPGSGSVVVFSIGYEGKTLEAFIAILKAAGVQRLVDVRDAPFSRKPGFSKKPLEQALERAGIEYVGIPELGTEKALRDRYKAGMDPAEFLVEYRRGLERRMGEYVCLMGLAMQMRSAIMCFERDHQDCHRQVIEERMEMDGFKIVHLGEVGQEKLEDIDRK